jgi:hypothetical protein
LNDLVAYSGAPVTKSQIGFQGNIFALLIEEAELDRSRNEDSMYCSSVLVLTLQVLNLQQPESKQAHD